MEAVVRRTFVLLVVFALVILPGGCGDSSDGATTVGPGRTPEDAQARYSQEVQQWWAEWLPEIERHFDVLDEFDLLDPSSGNQKAISGLAGVLKQAAEEFGRIEPTQAAATAHADYLSTLHSMSEGFGQLQKALVKDDFAGVMAAMGALEDLMSRSEAVVVALEDAVGVDLRGSGASGSTPADGGASVADKGPGGKDDPVPLGTAGRVGDWAVTIEQYTPDATAAVLEANLFNDEPEAGETYVLIGITAEYVGKESGTFWIDMSYKLLGSSGNTFETPMAVAPQSITDASEAFPGASVSGNLVFLVPVDQSTGALLIMEESFSFDDSRLFFALE